MSKVSKVSKVSEVSWLEVKLFVLTLVSYPLPRFNRFRPSGERHEVALDDVAGVGRAEP